MPTFANIHRSPGLSPDEVKSTGAAVAESVHATFKRIYVDLYQGFIVSVYEADSKEAVEEELERLGFPWDEIHEIQIELDAAALQVASEEEAQS